ncbi:hypothetical protein MTO96_031913 [Rhipicephalus appendiculatus]
MGQRGTLKGFLAGMGADVLDEVVLVPEGLVALVTLVRALACVRSLVVLYGIGIRCGVVAHGTLPQMFSTARAWKRRSATPAMHGERICAVGSGKTSANRNVKKTKVTVASICEPIPFSCIPFKIDLSVLYLRRLQFCICVGFQSLK